MIATPCQTLSRARRGCPPPLRTNEFPWGLEGLSAVDCEKVRVGNVLTRFTLKLIRLCLQMRIPCVVENPLTSMFWVLPEVLRLLACPHVKLERIDVCQFGTRWRKATRFMLCNIPDDARKLLEPFKCSGRGVCSRTGRPHLELSGKAPNGKFWTLIAQPYPRRLCKKLAEVFHASYLARG